MDRKELIRRIKYGEGQLMVWQGRIAYAQAEVLSGHYKARAVQRLNGETLSDEEKLHEAMSVIGRHLQFMSEVLDHTDRYREMLDELD